MGRVLRIARNVFDRVIWYPPAETRMPLWGIVRALVSSSEFDKALRRYLSVEQCILANSGRALLTRLLEVLKRRSVRTRDEVLLPAYTCYSVAAAVVRAGLKIGLYDIDPRTGAPDIESAARGAGPRTLAILSQHLFGIPCDMKGLTSLAGAHSSYLIEDAAQALGGRLAGHSLGTLGDFGLFSFGRGKSLPLGSGGALVGRHPDVLDEVSRGFSSAAVASGYGRLVSTAATQILSRGAFYWIVETLPLGLGATVFDPRFPIGPMTARVRSLGVYALRTLENVNSHRRTIARLYVEELAKTPSWAGVSGGVPVYTRYPVIHDGRHLGHGLRRVGVRHMYPEALSVVECVRPHLVDPHVRTPGAMHVAARLLTLPTHTGVSAAVSLSIARVFNGEL